VSEVQSSGEYRRIVRLGSGDLGNVFLAVASAGAESRKIVVLKELHPELAEDAGVLSLFLDEARLSTQLHHPNIVETTEVGFDGEHYFIAAEYLDGQPLRRVIDSLGTMPLPIALHCLVGVLDGLHYAHELVGADGAPLDMVHRDVSPTNVFLTYDGQVKILGFGTAKAKDSSYATRAGVLRGSAGYMSKERAVQSYDRRADIFSVGVILWEAIAGRGMWEGKSDPQILQALLRGDVPAIRAAKPDVDPALEQLCSRALAPVDERYAMADEMSRDVRAHLGRFGVEVTSRDLGSLVSRAFEAERERMRAIIETQLRRDKELPIDALPSVHYGAGFDIPAVEADGKKEAPPESVSPLTPPRAAATTSTVRPGARAPAGRRWPLVGGVVAVLIVAVAALLASRGERAVSPEPGRDNAASPTTTPP
jgi:eukaryotic-like serine/threonine-protein kinase